MKCLRIPSCAAIALLLVTPPAYTQRLVLPELTRQVNDFAHVIDPASVAALDAAVRSLQRLTGDMVIVATLESCGDAPSIKACSMTLFENHGRGIGQAGKDNGVLLLAVPSMRQARITTGLGIERIITDDDAASIVATMIESFRAGRYGEGFQKGIDRIATRLRQARNR
jgi:uncharacterized protein